MAVEAVSNLDAYNRYKIRVKYTQQQQQYFSYKRHIIYRVSLEIIIIKEQRTERRKKKKGYLEVHRYGARGTTMSRMAPTRSRTTLRRTDDKQLHVMKNISTTDLR